MCHLLWRFWINIGEIIIYKCSYLLTERPFEQRVKLAPHDDKEQGKMCSSARPITIQIQSQAHFVAVFAGVKRCEEESKMSTEPKCENRSNIYTL